MAPHFRALVEALALDAGEQEALSCQELNAGGVLLTDDTAARLAAQSLGYCVHGTVGVLLRADRRGQRSAGEVVALLEGIP
jgi:predicted nucleic acid-binding protein